MRVSNNFDGVRLVAALSVLVSHEFYIAGLSEPSPLGHLTLGGIGLLMFFAISGYLVASSWTADPKVWRFAARRFLRIWPAYVVVVVGAASWVAWTDPRKLASLAAWVFVRKHLLFQPFEWDFFSTLRDPRLNAPLWTIPFEIGCYVAFAIVAAASCKWWPPLLAGAGGLAFVVWALGMGTFDPSAVDLMKDAVFFGALFGCGAVLYGLPMLRAPKATAGLLVAGVLAFVAGSQVIGLALAVPTLTVLVGTRSWPVLSRADHFGDLSYGIYLWAWPMQQLVATHLGVQAGVWRLLGVSLLAVTPMALLSWHLIEKRALAAKPSSRTPWPRALTLTLT